MVLGIVNTRFKDFYDIWKLSREREFESSVLGQAIEATFVRRGSTLPSAVPEALTSVFSASSEKKTQWQAFVRKARLDEAPLRRRPAFE